MSFIWKGGELLWDVATGADRSRILRQLPPVLEGDVTPSRKAPADSSRSAANLSATDTSFRPVNEAWPSDSEASASESTVTTASIAESTNAVTVAKNVRRMTEPNVQPAAKKSPRSYGLGKNTSSRKLSKASPGAASSGDFKADTRVDSSEEQWLGFYVPDHGPNVWNAGSPTPRQSQVSLATPPRTKRASMGERPGKLQKSPQPLAVEARSESSLRATSQKARLSASSKLEKFRVQRGAARHLATALGDDARDAFRRALLQGTHQPRCAKLGFVGPARAGKTSTLQALAGLPLRRDQESTHGLACWALSQELLSAAPGQRWQLQEAHAVTSSSRWDRGVAKYVADLVRRPGSATSSSAKMGKQALDDKVMKRMPVDLIARRLGETAANVNSSSEDKAVVLEAYDFGGQEVYYAMHHLFLSDYGIYLACIDLSAFNLADDSANEGDGMKEKESEASNTWQAMEWWLASIAVHAPNSPVAIVGTHNDCLSQNSRRRVYAEVNERISAFCAKLPELNEQLQINEQTQLCFFPVDNACTDGGRSLADLREAIENMTAKLLQGPLGTPIPLRWSHFWAVLQRTGGNGNLGPLTRVEELWQRCRRYGFESQGELQNFLRHFHGLGALLHFPDSVFEELRDLICLKPGWVGDAAAAVLTAKDKVFQGCVNHVAELKEKGLIHVQLLAAVWRARHFAKHQAELIGLLQALDLLLAWGDKQNPLQQQIVFLVPSQLPMRPLREREGDEKEDGCVLYLDFHGLLRRLLPTLIPRLLCSLSKVESGVQILSVYANFATFAVSTQGQAQGDSLRCSGHWRPREILLVSVQPCGNLLRCSLRPRRSEVPARQSWRHVERLLHNFREAITAWMPRISFRAGIRCPACTAGHTHVLDLHGVLREEDLAVCPRSGDLVEDLPPWLLEWRQHHLQRARPGSPRCVPPLEEDAGTRTASKGQEAIKPGEERAGQAAGLHLDYLYASPLDVAPLDIRAEIEALATMPGVEVLSVRTATTETLAEVWRTERPSSAPRVLVLAAHCAVEKAQPALLLEDAVGHAHVVDIRDLDELLALNGPDLAAGDSSSLPADNFDVVIVDACHSESLAQRFVASGASCAIACSGEVFDAAAREFLRIFLRSLAAAVPKSAHPVTGLARASFAAAQRAVRLSPQPGLRSEAEHFRFFPAKLAPGPDVPLSRYSSTMPRFAGLDGHDLPAPVEDFVGRGSTMAAVASAFLGHRRVVWLHGKAGIGKSAFISEFCRFYGLPGDRLFSPSAVRLCRSRELPSEAEAAAGGPATCSRKAVRVRLSGLGPLAAIAKLRESLTGSRCAFLALDGVEQSFGASEPAVAELWAFLEECLVESPGLRVLLASQRPRYDAPLSRKVVAVELPPLSREDACLLLARRSHRPLYPRDLDGPSCRNAVGDLPLALSGRRREFLQRLAEHPLVAKMGNTPAEVIAAAGQINPQLPSLFQHPLLQDSPNAKPGELSGDPSSPSAST
ncbi:pats1 [Symbiodinium pilosum]|uniref:non-specific serine/threonine protein kinase n=1 Tax=Symbiodinium pilosum TaxID=2952 RepID=A0A812W658_SYMPI|nr:pats1 [Symbiodinium pilosum]